MKFYDIDGNRIYLNNANTEIPYLAASGNGKIKCQTPVDMSSFGLIQEFTAFAEDYSTQQGTPRVLNITVSEFLQTFYDAYLGYNGKTLVTKKRIGKDQSGEYDIVCYDLIPEKPKRKVLITSGMHTYELPASFGLARWVKELLTSNESVFEYLRENVQFSIIPILNPWGFNQNPKKYGNINGVNPARNFDDWTHGWNDFPVYTPDQNEWNVKGSEPFSEAEVRTLADWLRSNTDANFYIDCHTGLGNSRSSQGDVWIYYSASHPLKTQILAARDALVSYLSDKYHVTATHKDVIDIADVSNHRYSNKVVGIPMMTIEQCQHSNTIYQTVPNNSAVAITEYATQIHAFVLAQLQA